MSTSKIPMLFLATSLALTMYWFLGMTESPIIMPMGSLSAGVGVILLGLERSKSDNASGKRFYIVGSLGILVGTIALIASWLF